MIACKYQNALGGDYSLGVPGPMKRRRIDRETGGYYVTLEDYGCPLFTTKQFLDFVYRVKAWDFNVSFTATDGSESDTFSETRTVSSAAASEIDLYKGYFLELISTNDTGVSPNYSGYSMGDSDENQSAVPADRTGQTGAIDPNGAELYYDIAFWASTPTATVEAGQGTGYMGNPGSRTVVGTGKFIYLDHEVTFPVYADPSSTATISNLVFEVTASEFWTYGGIYSSTP